MGRRAIAVGILALGVAVGAFSLDVARDDPAYWFAGASGVAGAAFLAAGWALIGGGLVFWVRRPGSRFGPLLTAAGFAWFLAEWSNPGIGSSLAFTVGLCLYAACPPLVAHAVLAYPGGRLGSRAERGAVAVAYAGSLLVLGVLPALFRDPHAQAQGCTQCPDNLVLVEDRSSLAEDLTRAGVYLGLAWAIALAMLAALKFARAPSAARPVFAAGALYLGLVAGMFAASLESGFLANGTAEKRLWFGEAAALVALSALVGWSWVREPPSPLGRGTARRRPRTVAASGGLGTCSPGSRAIQTSSSPTRSAPVAVSSTRGAGRSSWTIARNRRSSSRTGMSWPCSPTRLGSSPTNSMSTR